MNYPLPQHRSVVSLLEEAIEVLRGEIEFLRSAPVAAKGEYLEEEEQERNGITFRYTYLTTYKSRKHKTRRKLGTIGDAQHLEWVERIKRRDRILAIQKEIEALQGVLDRRLLTQTPELF